MKRTYILCYLPEENIYNKYQKVISRISTSYHTEKFSSHITLIKNLELSESEVLSYTNKLIKFLKPITTKFLDFEYSDRRYRSLYITIQKTQELLEAHNKANQIFNHTEEPFLPHLSLAYGELSIINKLKIINELKPLDKQYFTLDKLIIYDITQENGEPWQEIKRYKL